MKTRSIFHASTLAFVLVTSSILDARAQQSGSQQGQPFFFEGGIPAAFVAAIDKHFGLNGDLVAIAEIDPAMRDAMVPKIRIRKGDPLGALLVYDELTGSNPRLGRLSVSSQDVSREIQSLSFLPAAAAGEGEDAPEIVSRIYNIRDVAGEGPGVLEERFEALDTLVKESGGADLDLRYHAEGGLLLVRAPEYHHDMVDSLIKAYREEVQDRRAEEAERKDKLRKLEDLIPEGLHRLRSYERTQSILQKSFEMLEAELKLKQVHFRNGSATQEEVSEIGRKKLGAEKELEELELKMERMRIEVERFIKDQKELQKEADAETKSSGRQ